jgi:hypothetical protein
MRRQTVLPRLAREGWVPAAPEKRVNKRAMLIPKISPRPEFIPALPEHELSWLAGALGPPERRALREIVDTGDLVKENGHTYLVARVSSETIDAMAAFEAEGEDMENDLCDEPSEDPEMEPDDEPDHDDEYDFPRERQKYIKDRQTPGRGQIWQGGRLIYRPTYDVTKDRDELREIKRQVNALAAKKRKRVKA